MARCEICDKQPSHGKKLSITRSHKVKDHHVLGNQT